jgi:hypothetical protein
MKDMSILRYESPVNQNLVVFAKRDVHGADLG